MKIFKCPKCSATIYFENTSCGECGSAIGFDSKTLEFRIIDSIDSSQYATSSAPAIYCGNHSLSICNWLLEDPRDIYCRSCWPNRTVPQISDRENFEKWRELESAKRRLVYQLIRLDLPVQGNTPGNMNGLTFDFLPEDNPDGAMTGHAGGVVTIILREADSVAREQIRMNMSEAYRTLIGHFRHEIAHYYWPHIIPDRKLAEFRTLFGDERLDYSESLENYYENGPSQNWSTSYISAYAASHPWEDWAETFAHYLHIMDLLETAHYSGVGLTMKASDQFPTKCPNPYFLHDFNVISDWSVELTVAGNSMNRSMGLPDIYPFIIPNPVYEKLNFIHGLFKEPIHLKAN